MAYLVKHTQVGQPQPHWYLLERWDEGHRQQAMRRARQYALDNGGYVAVMDNDGKTIFGTDPAQLDIAIASGINRDFRPQVTAPLPATISVRD